MAEAFTALETGLALLYGTFVKYAASEEGDNPTTISKKELSKMMAEQLPQLPGDGILGDVMKELDQDKDGSMDFKEYCILMTGLSLAIHMIDGILGDVMKELDEDKDGSMDFKEYCILMTGLSLAIHMIDGILGDVMKELDEDKDGSMDFKEYCILMTGLSLAIHMIVTKHTDSK
ncbi:hypothetical protein NHX12_023814 [Muraenolepis orangiensis]|uniref:EF-hand domain-containing protein n=1 Tax=Muraenolepis orangiensis TaxID=630683 RepID=A0A9Q0ELT9_9TELE|nr:hypothetical protein NHX12_023814 [Muraenolepis orangiensis]